MNLCHSSLDEVGWLRDFIRNTKVPLRKVLTLRKHSIPSSPSFSSYNKQQNELSYLLNNSFLSLVPVISHSRSSHFESFVMNKQWLWCNLIGASEIFPSIRSAATEHLSFSGCFAFISNCLCRMCVLIIWFLISLNCASHYLEMSMCVFMLKVCSSNFRTATDIQKT